MDIQLNDIALFVEVAKRKNFSHAAEALHMPASTLSRRVSELEQSIGMKLLNRSTRRIELTEAGLMYFERCRPRSEEHTSELQSLMRISYAVFCLNKNKKKKNN